MRKYITKNKKRIIIMLVCFCLTFLVRVILNLNIKNPWAMGDELGVMATGAYFAGYDWRQVLQLLNSDGGGANFYNGGFGIFLTPLFCLIKGRPYFLYQAILCVCALMQSLVVLISYQIMTKCFNIKNYYFCGAISVASSFFSVSRATNAMNESALILCTWGIIYLIMLLVQENSNKRVTIYSILLALILGYSYTIHTRTIVLIFSVIVAILFISFLNKKSLVRLSVFFLCLVGALLAAMKFNTFVLENVFVINDESQVLNTGQTATISVFEGIKLFFKGGQWQAFGDVFLGNLFGLNLITINIFFVVFFVWLRSFWTNIYQVVFKKNSPIIRKDDGFIMLGLVVYICAFGMVFLYSIHVLANSIVAIQSESCTRSFFYLRYPGAFCGPIILMAGIIIWNCRTKIWKEIIALCIAGILCFSYVCVSILPRISEHGDAQFDYYHFFAPFYLGKFADEVLSNKIYIAFSITIILFILGIVLYIKRKRILLAIFCMSVFVYQYGYLAINYDAPQAEKINKYVYYVSETYYWNPDLKDKINTLYWPIIAGSWEAPYVAQYYMPELTVIKEVPQNVENFTMIAATLVDSNILQQEQCYWAQLDDYTYLYVKGKDKEVWEDLGIVFEEI